MQLNMNEIAAVPERVLCPECKGGDVPLDEFDIDIKRRDNCPRCAGVGTIPKETESVTK